MRVRLGSGLIPLNLLAWALILVIIFVPSDIPRIILGIPFLLFSPGYALMAALYTRKAGMGGIERVALSVALSIAVVPLTGLVLNYTPLGITLEPILYSVASFILVTSIIAWLRRSRLKREERFDVELYLRLPDQAWDKVLAITLVVAITGALGMIGYILTTPREKEAFTEFYVLGPGGQASDYPKELKVGEEGKVIVGIINHEGKEVSYRVEVVMGSKKSAELGPVMLADEQKWEGEVGLVPEVVGENQEVDFLLYKGNETEPYLEALRLRINVKE